jgi:hypothetical protein
MHANLRTKLRLFLLIAGALASCAPVWSDAGALTGTGQTKRMCYCGCDEKPGSPMCMHMCNLAKYENRSWATSCHKPAKSDPQQHSSVPDAHSAKYNGVQEARR